MGSVAEYLSDIGCVDREVLPVHRGALPESSAVDKPQPVSIGQRLLRLPGRGGIEHIAVYEHHWYAGAALDHLDRHHLRCTP
ncbi:hypothetical protein GCM10010530_19510 [Kribbella aluminosa]